LAPTPAVVVTEPDKPALTVAEPDKPAPVPLDDGSVILTISGDGVSEDSEWTLGQLQALEDGYREIVYSTTNNWPTYGYMEVHGVSLPYLLEQAGLLDEAASFRFVSTDGYYAMITRDQIFGTRYAYADHSPLGSGAATVVEPLIGWMWGEPGTVRDEDLRPFFGQGGPLEVNTSTFVKDLHRIEVSSESAGLWSAPGADIPDFSTVSAGTELTLSHSEMDNVRIYYTLDGSVPDYESSVYNTSTSYFQPQLIVPLVLTESVTLKAFAAGYGKDVSPVVTYDYTVE